MVDIDELNYSLCTIVIDLTRTACILYTSISQYHKLIEYHQAPKKVPLSCPVNDTLINWCHMAPSYQSALGWGVNMNLGIYAFYGAKWLYHIKVPTGNFSSAIVLIDIQDFHQKSVWMAPIRRYNSWHPLKCNGSGTSYQLRVSNGYYCQAPPAHLSIYISQSPWAHREGVATIIRSETDSLQQDSTNVK